MTLTQSKCFLALVFGLVVVLPGITHANSISPDLVCVEDLWQLAEKVFDGTCTAAESTYLRVDGRKIPVTIYTFQLNETFKGTFSASSIRFAQLGMVTPPADVDIYVPAVGTRYRIGGRYVVFLSEESRLTLTAPIGFGRGTFRVEEADAGQVVSNDILNRDLLSCGGAPIEELTSAELNEVSEQGAGLISLDSFSAILRSLPSL